MRTSIAFALIVFASLLIRAQEAPVKPADSVVSVADGVAVIRPFARITHPDIGECSGLQWFDGAWWANNDSGDGPYLYRSKTLDFTDAEKLTVLDAVAVDWEELAVLNGHLLVCDVGDNRRMRSDLKLYEVRYVAGDDGGKLELVANYSIKYPDGKHDCEAVFSADGKLHMISKNRGEGAHNIYCFDDLKSGELNTAKKIGTFDIDVREQITSADYDGETLVVLTYTHIYTTAIDKLTEKPNAIVIEAKQCEAIAWNGGSLIYSNEQRDVYKIDNFNKREVSTAQPARAEVTLPLHKGFELKIDGSGEAWKDKATSLPLNNLQADEYYQWAIIGSSLYIAGKINYTGSVFTTTTGSNPGAGLLLMFNPKADVFAESTIRQFTVGEKIHGGMGCWRLEFGQETKLHDTTAKVMGSTKDKRFQFEIKIPLTMIFEEGELPDVFYTNVIGRSLHESRSIVNLANDRIQNMSHPYTWAKVTIDRK